MLEYKTFQTKNGNILSLVRFIEPDWLLVWENVNNYNGFYHEICKGYKVYDIEIDELKRIGVWNKLSSDIKKKINDSASEITKHDITKVEKKKRNKYSNIPKELVCIKCGTKISIQPSILVSRLKKISEQKDTLMSVDDYVKNYQCQKCNPTKGRRSKINSLIPNIPKIIELKCQCGIIKCFPINYIISRAQKKNISVEEFIKNYQCQKCNPTKGRRSKINSPNDMSNMPNIPKILELKCQCGIIKCFPINYIISRAQKKNISVEEFIKNYQCQKCNPTKGRRSKEYKNVILQSSLVTS